MVNSNAFAERLQIIINHYALNASSFADRIGVQRSGISHILAGRNKPSLDFVLKVIDEFKEIDLYWLLIGKGVFPPAEDKVENSQSRNTHPEIPDLIKTGEPLIQKKIQPSKTKEKKEIQIIKIILLYENGSFDSFEN